MFDIKQVKARGRAAFKANYWASVIVSLLLTALVGGGFVIGRNQTSGAVQLPESSQQQLETTGNQVIEALNSMSPEDQALIATTIFGVVSIVTVVGFLLKVFVFNPLQVGCYRFYRKNVNDPTTGIGVVGEGFGDFGHVFITLLLRDIFIVLWTALLFIPGIIKAYSYTLVPYIIKDNPELSATQAITRSRELMRGNKGRAFLMDLSFLGWFLLGALSFNLVNIFWTNPYRENAKAAMYLELCNR